MVPILHMTPQETARYELIRGSFLDMDCTFFGGGRAFGWYGKMDVSNEGRIAVRDLVVACSREHKESELVAEIHQLRQRIAGGDWDISAETDRSIAATAGMFGIRLNSISTRYNTTATHFLLSYGDSQQYEARHLEERFTLAAEASGDPVEDRAHYYPVSVSQAPGKAESISPEAFISRIRGKSLVAFTGAGISLSSGIPTFAGRGGLADHFPLVEPFPGEIAKWMIDCPLKLAETFGAFQAGFIVAQPNPAHMALSQLEQAQVLRHVITGNADLLHERAGSRKVHGKGAVHFVGTDEGWAWIQEGEAMLVIGVARDEHGFISYARKNSIQIIAIAPDRPNFLCEGDWFVQGRAEAVLPPLVEQMRGNGS